MTCLGFSLAIALSATIAISFSVYMYQRDLRKWNKRRQSSLGASAALDEFTGAWDWKQGDNGGGSGTVGPPRGYMPEASTHDYNTDNYSYDHDHDSGGDSGD